MKTLIAKELRENLKWLLVGLALMLALAYMGVPKYINDSSHRLSEYLGFAGGLFAIFLGVVQSAWDFSERQQGFLLHRATSKRVVIASKLISGAIIYAVVLSVPLMLSAMYFTVVGPEYLPVRPLQIVGTVFLAGACYFLHPATLFAMIRPARWFGTKALPLIVPALICFISYASFSNTWVYWLAAVVEVLILSSFALAINFQRGLVKPVLVLNSFAVAAIVAIVLIASIENVRNYNRFSNLQQSRTAKGIDDDGILWEYRDRKVYDPEDGGWKSEYISGSPMSSEKETNIDGRLPEKFSPHELTYLLSLNAYATASGTISSLGFSTSSRCMYWDQRGYILVYDTTKNPPLVGTITRDGFTPGNSPKGTRFNINPFGAMRSAGMIGGYANRLGSLAFIADYNGVYLLNQSTGELKVVVDTPIKNAFPLAGEFGTPIEFIVDTGKVWEKYQVEGFPNEPTTRIVPLNPKDLIVSKTTSYPRLPESESQWALGSSSSGRLAATTNEYGTTKIASISSLDQAEWLIQPVKQPSNASANTPDGLVSLIAAMTPIAILVPLCGIAAWQFINHESMAAFMEGFSDSNNQQILLEIMLGLSAVTTITALALYFSLRQRRTDKRSFLLWFALLPILGMATPLAVISIFPKLTFETCPKCDRKRRVDRTKCEKCGAGWEPLPLQGIEIIEGNALANVASI